MMCQKFFVSLRWYGRTAAVVIRTLHGSIDYRLATFLDLLARVESCTRAVMSRGQVKSVPYSFHRVVCLYSL